MLFHVYNEPPASKIRVFDLFAPSSKELINLSEISTDVQYIPLQTLENSVIRFIDQIKIANNKIYVFPLHKILCFDNSGQFLYNLDKEGRGPGEYVAMLDFDIDPENHLLLIKAEKKLSIYNETSEGFVFSKSLKFNDQISKVDFVPGQKNILISCSSSAGNEPFRNILINPNGDTLASRPNNYKYQLNKNMLIGITYDNIIFDFNNLIYFKDINCDTVFTIDKQNRIAPSYILDTHGKNITPEILLEHNLDKMAQYLEVRNIMEVSRYFLCKYLFSKEVNYTIWDKVLNKKFSIKNKQFLKDDITGGPNFEPKCCISGKFYSWVDALSFKKYISSDTFKKSTVKNPEKKKSLEKLADSLEETDNPILVVVTPKE
jgi:hypothetical protein